MACGNRFSLHHGFGTLNLAGESDGARWAERTLLKLKTHGQEIKKVVLTVKALNTLQYAGDRVFKSEKRRDTLRDSGDLVARARGLYLEQRWDSRTHKQAVSVVCKTLDLKRRRVNAWAAKFSWEGDV